MKGFREKIVKGMLDIIVLRLVADNTTHGYKIIRTIQKRYGVYLGPSTIYPLLNRLAKKGYVTCEWVFPSRKHGLKVKLRANPRKVYTITQKGRTLLGCGQTELEAVVAPLIRVKT